MNIRLTAAMAINLVLYIYTMTSIVINVTNTSKKIIDWISTILKSATQFLKNEKQKNSGILCRNQSYAHIQIIMLQIDD